VLELLIEHERADCAASSMNNNNAALYSVTALV